MLRVVADLGNSRLKWGRVDASERVVDVVALPAENPEAWRDAWRLWPGSEGPSVWTIASVNPPAARRLADFLEARGVEPVSWYTSAAQVGLSHALRNPETAGADRAIAVSAAVGRRTDDRPGLVVLCGTALTVERISADGVWQGGAIAAGLGLTARALHAQTAQLPLVEPHAGPPRAWGDATEPAIEAGIFWGVVGAARELLTRQAVGLGADPWVVWSGGDAAGLAEAVDWPGAVVVPDLVLDGLAERARRG